MLRTTLLILSCAALTAQAQTITTYRWWVDDDLATLTTTPVAPQADLDLQVTEDLSGLDGAFHTITWQFLDSDGNYSVPYTTYVTRSTGPVGAYSWWIDDDITNGVTAPIGPNAVVDLVADLPTGITSGTHVLTIRFQGNTGVWSVPLSSEFSFYTAIDELPGVSDLLVFPNPATEQLFLRVDATTAQQLAIEVLDAQGRAVLRQGGWQVSGTTLQAFDLNGLAAGTYRLRVQGDAGGWSTTFVKH